MKKFTITASVFFVVLFIGMVGYVALSEDFVPPQETAGEVHEVAPDAPVWNMTMDELITYLEEKQLIDASTEQEISAGGLCSAAKNYNGADIYWWDLENLDEESEEYKAYESLEAEGEIDLYGSGTILTPVKNGPFAILLTYYEGDAKELEDTFFAFAQEE